MKRYWIRLLLVGLYTVFHLYALRTVRTELFTTQVDDMFIQAVEKNEYLSFRTLDTRLFYVDYITPDETHTWHYKMPFGSFFFLGIIGLIATGADKIHYYALISIHGVVTITASILFSFDVAANVEWLYVTDFLCRYLIPLISLGMVPIAVFDRRVSGKDT